MTDAPPQPPPAVHDLDARVAIRERRDARMRRYLLVSGIMLVVLCGLNIALFGRDAWDAVFWLGAGLAIACGLYQFYGRVMGILRWFWVALTVPYWLAAAFLLYHMVLALNVQMRYRDAPQLAAQLAEFTEKDFVEHQHVGGFEPDTVQWSPDPAIKYDSVTFNQLAVIWRQLRDSGDLDAVLTDPNLKEKLEKVLPLIDEANAAAHAAEKAPQDLARDLMLRDYDLVHVTEAMALRGILLAQDGRTAEAQVQLKALHNFVMHSWMSYPTAIALLHSIAVMAQTTGHMPAEVLDPAMRDFIIAEVADVRQVVAPTATRLSKSDLAYFADKIQDPDLPIITRLWLRDTHDFALSPQLDHVKRPLLNATVFRFMNRQFYWPFFVKELGMEQARRSTELELQLIHDAPRADLSDAAKFPPNLSRTRLLLPDPGGRLLVGIYGRSRFVSLLDYAAANSCLAAYEYALRWRRGDVGAAPGQIPLDPMTGRPFHVQLTQERDALGEPLERLRVLGGDVTRYREVSNRRDSAMALSTVSEPGVYQYQLEMTRPAATDFAPTP